MKRSSQLRKQQKMLLFTGLFVFFVLILSGLWISEPKQQKTNVNKSQQKNNKEEVFKSFSARNNSSQLSAKEHWLNLSEKEIKILKSDNKKLKQEIEQLSSKFEEQLEELKNNKALDAEKAIEESFKNAILSSMSNSNDNKNYNMNIERNIEVFTLFELDDLNTEKDESKSIKNVTHYLPAGSFAKVMLLSGLDVHTGSAARGTPLPVLLKLLDSGQLANFWHSAIKDCHAIGAAYGDMSSERAYIRLEKLTCILENGDIVEEPLKGYVAGEDGKAGFRGRIVSKQGALIAKSLFAGVASGFGDILSGKYQDISTNALGSVTSPKDNLTVGDMTLAGLGKGGASALNKIADFYIERANEIYPIIEISAQRIGEIVLLEGTDFNVDLVNKSEGN